MPSFAVANMNPGEARCEMFTALLALQDAETIRFLQRITTGDTSDEVTLEHVLPKISGPYLDTGRNAVVRAVLDGTPADYLVFVDSDIAPQVDDFYRLVETAHRHGCDVLSGVYWSASVWGRDLWPVVYRWGVKDGARALVDLTADDLDGLDAGKPPEVDGVGAGFLCLSRSMLERMRARYGDPLPWFVCETRDGVHYGEDLGFCLRCADMGVPVHVLPDLTVAHYKTVRLER